jgi:putative ABC transport system permease protein
MASDIRYAIRSLGRAKGFTIITILTLALGIGSAAAIFSVVDWVLFQSDGFPADLYIVGETSKWARFSAGVMDPQYQAYRTQADVFSDSALVSSQALNVALGADPVDTHVLAVSSNFMPLFRIAPVLGRGFLPDENVEGRNNVVVISDDFWQQRLAGSADVLGRKIRVGLKVCTIVGVLGRGQRLPPYCYSRVFMPLAYTPDPMRPWEPYLEMFARLRTGIPPKEAEAALAKAKPVPPPRYAHMFDETRPVLSTVAEQQRTDRPEVYWMMVGAVGFLFTIACLNASNLMLVRMLGKRREVSVRLALGGGPWSIIKLFLAESIGLSLAACAAGLLFANWLIPLFHLVAGSSPEGIQWSRWSLNWRATSALACLTLLCAAVIVVVPTLKILGTGIQAGLKEGGAALGESRGLARLRGTIVVLQATFAVVLLTGAGLMVRTLHRLQDVNLGFDPSRRVKVNLYFPNGYPDVSAERLALLERLKDRFQRVPGVASVAFGSDCILAGYNPGGTTLVLPDGSTIDTGLAWVTPDFQKVAGLVIRRGRWVAWDSKNDVDVNETLARALFGRDDPIGQVVRMKGMPLKGSGGFTVVGVIGEMREKVRSPPANLMIWPGSEYPPAMTSFVVQMTRDPGKEIAGLFRKAVYETDPRIVTAEAVSMIDARDLQLRLERLAMSVLKVLSGIATALTIIGLFSILAYTVDQRMGEFGVRIAMGATPRSLVVLVLRRAMFFAGIGLLLGVGGALALTRYLQSLLYETPPYDPAVLALVVVSLAAAAIAACALPAFRAAHADVSRLLKAE